MLPDHLRQVALQQRGLLTDAVLADAKVSNELLRSWLDAKLLKKVVPTVYLLGTRRITDDVLRRAASLWCPEAVLSHRTAARVHGWNFLKAPADVDLLFTGTLPRARNGIVLRRTESLPDEDIKVVDGLRVTSKARTLVDLAGTLDEDELSYAVEKCIHDKVVALDWLQRRLKELRTSGRRGVRNLERVLDDHVARKAVLQSALEVRFWRRVRDAGFPLPLCQHRFDDDYGQPAWIDFAWPRALLAVETRGAKFHATRVGFEANARRTARMTAQGWSVMAVTWSMLDEDEKRVLQQVREALEVRGIFVRPLRQASFELALAPEPRQRE